MANEKRWFENKEFWLDMERKVYSAEQWTAALREAEEALVLLNISSSATILDMGCGNGRHSMALARLGHSVTGVDLNERYLSAATEQARREKSDATFVRGDMRTFRRNNTYDAAMILWNAFGYFESDDEDIMTLTSLNASLKAGGRLLLQTHGRESTARKFIRKDWFEIDGSFVLDQRWIEKDWTRMRTRYVVIDEHSRREHMMSCRLYAPTDLEALLRQAGFENVKFFGALSGVPYDERAFELVAVSSKKAVHPEEIGVPL